MIKAIFSDIKKLHKSLLISLATIFLLTGCSQASSYNMSIKPSDFSEETRQVINLFNDELQFFDIEVDETVKSYSIALWVYKDEEWQEAGKTYGKIEYLDSQIAIHLSETAYKLFSINEKGHSTYSYTFETDFEDSLTIGGSRIDTETPLELNKEIPIWVKVGTVENSMRVIPITEDFRNSECNAGVAVTLTISDEIVE